MPSDGVPADTATVLPRKPPPGRFIDTGSEAFGLFCGCVLAVGASTSFAFARAGILAGFSPGDLILLRFGVSGLLLLPLVWRAGLWSLAGIGWSRGMVLLALGGPGFALMQSGGYAFAPLAHGGVIPSGVGHGAVHPDGRGLPARTVEPIAHRRRCRGRAWHRADRLA